MRLHLLPLTTLHTHVLLGIPEAPRHDRCPICRRAIETRDVADCERCGAVMHAGCYVRRLARLDEAALLISPATTSAEERRHVFLCPVCRS